MEDYIKSFIREIPDFPKPGIGFKDITPLLANASAMQMVCRHFEKIFDPSSFDIIVGPESRGFIFGTALSIHLGKGFVPIRKPGKLPGLTHKVNYALEYGTDSLEIHQDAISNQQRVLIIDDLLATGGTVKATHELVNKCGGQVVGAGFLIELSFLDGRQKLSPLRVESIIQYLTE